MIEAVVSKVVTSKLKKYIEKVKGSQMQMKLWKGSASFDNLTLKSTALSNHDLPLVIKKGTIGHVHVAFPWKSLTTEPCIVEISDVFIVANIDEEILVRKELETVKQDETEANKKKTAKERKETWQSLTDTIIDNARLSIKNVHIRLEYVLSGKKFVAAGFVVPRIEFFTVDRDNEIITTVQKFPVLRKRLEMEDLAMYFDTTAEEVNLANFEGTMQMLMSKRYIRDHQLIMEPLSIECILVHTRNNPEAIKNQLRVTTKEIGFSVDFMQCRAFLEVSSVWKKLLKRRNFSHCHRPKEGRKVEDKSVFWRYMHRCARAKAYNNLIFEPEIAMNVLRTRQKYLKLYKKKLASSKKKAGALSTVLSTIQRTGNNLEKLRQSVGVEMTALLDYMASELCKRQMTAQEKEPETLDLSQLTQFLDTSNKFFSSSSFTAALEIPSVHLSFNFLAGVPLATLDVTHVSGDITSLSTGITSYVELGNLKMDSHVNENPVPILIPRLTEDKPFLRFEAVVPSSKDPHTCQISLAGCDVNIDIPTIENASNFFVDFSMQLESREVKTVCVDVGEVYVRMLSKLKNTNLAVDWDGCYVTCPVLRAPEQMTSLCFGISGVSVKKPADKIIEPEVDNYSMNYNFTFDIEPVVFADRDLLSSCTVQLTADMDLSSDHIDITSRVELNEAVVNAIDFDVRELLTAVGSLRKLAELGKKEDDTQQKTIKTVYTMDSLTFGLGFVVHKVTLHVEEKGYFADISLCGIVNDAFVEKNQVNFPFKIKGIEAMDSQDHHCVETTGDYFLDIGFADMDSEKKLCLLDVQGISADLKPAWILWLKEYGMSVLKALESSGEKTDKETKSAEGKTGIRISLNNLVLNLADEECQLGFNVPSLVFSGEKENEYSLKCNASVLNSVLEKPVLDPMDIDMVFRSETGQSNLNLDLSESTVRGSPEVARAVMRTLDHVLRLIQTEHGSEKKESPESSASTLVSVTLPKTIFECYEKDAVILQGQLDKLETSVETAESTKVEVNVCGVLATCASSNAMRPFTDLKQFAITMDFGKESSDIGMKVSADYLHISPHIICYGLSCLPKSKEPRKEKSSEKSDGTMHLNLKVDPCELVVFDELGDVAKTSLGSIALDTTLAAEMSSLNLELEKLVMLNCVNKQSEIVRLDTPFRMVLNEVGFSCVFTEMLLKCDIEFVLRVQGMLAQLSRRKEDTAPVEQSQESKGITLMNVDIEMPLLKITVESETSPSACEVSVKGAHFVVRSSQKVAAFQLESGMLSVGNSDRDGASIGGVDVVAEFGEKTSNSLSFDSVCSLSKESTRVPVTMKELYVNCVVDSTRFSYSHGMARVLIGFDPLLQALNSGGEKSSAPQRSESMNLTFDAKFKSVSGDLWAEKKLAAVVVQDLVLENQKEMSLSIGNIRIADENDYDVNLLRYPENEKLFVISQEGEGKVMNVGNIEVWVDYLFLASIASFILGTPFLKSSSSSNPEPSSSSSDSNSSPMTIRAANIHVVVPTRTDRDIKSQLFHMKTSLQMSLAKDQMDLSVLSFSLYFSDPKQCINYEPIFDNFHASVTRKVNSSQKVSYAVALSNVYIALSASDIVMFDKIRHCVDEAMKSAIIAHRESSGTKTDNTITDVAFTLGAGGKKGFELVLCRDNRTAQLFIPLFKFSIPPLEFNMNSTGTERGAAVISIEPKLEYFNEVSGKWDLMMEPCEFKVLAVLQHDLVHMSLVASSPLNINLPLLAVSQYMAMYKEIKSDVAKKNDIVTDYPRFWMENRLGTFLSLIVMTGSRSPVVYELEHGELIPTYHMELDSVIQVNFKSAIAVFCPQDLAYPTVVLPNVCVVKKSYKGGTLIQFNAHFQIKNDTCTTIEAYMKNGANWELLKTLAPHESAPIPFVDSNPQSFVFVDNSEKPKVKRQPVKISPKDTEPCFVPVSCKNRHLRCLRVTHDDRATGCRIFTLISSVRCMNLLPVSLYVLHADVDEPKQISPEGKEDLLSVWPDKGCSTYQLSIDRTNYISMGSLKMDSSDVQCLSVYNETVSAVTDITVIFEQEEDTKQVVITFFSPCVIFNTTKQSILVSEAFSEKCITVTPMLFGLWCPDGFLKDNGKLEMTLEIPKLTSQPQVVDCSSSIRDALFLRTDLADELYVPIRYDVRKSDRTSVMTLSTFLTITNELEESIVLQPILTIPKLVDTGDAYVGSASHSLLLGDPYVIEPGKEAMIDLMSLSGAFLLTVSGYSTSPALSFLTIQKSVFRVQSPERGTKIIELTVLDNGVTYQGYIRNCQFPTPIMIANCLEDATISAYQFTSIAPFEIAPQSTSVFAYDEPFAYPSVHLRFADKNLHISLLEITGTVVLQERYNDKPIMVTITGNSNGGKLVTISCEAPEPVVHSRYLFSWNIAMIRVSLIDNLLREFLLVTLKSISGDLGSDGPARVVKFSIENFQADDQRTLSKSPTVIHGRKCGSKPFLYLEATAPATAPLFSRFGYVNLTLQRIDCFFDASFISDWYYMGMTLSDSITSVIAPLEPSTSSSSVISLNWLQISPIFLFVSFKSTSKTPPTLGPILKYFKYIPSIGNIRILLPGILVAQVSNTVSDILEKITGDYKTIAFKQILDCLGVSGRIMTTFGIADIISQALHIAKQSSLTDQISQFSRSETEVFDNRKQVAGCFSHAALEQLSKRLESCEIETSTLIRQLLDGKETGLMIKTMPGQGFGHGVFGVLTRATMDTMPDVAVMQNVKRERVPRTFPGGHINVFDREVSNAQILIHREGKKFRDQRIYLAFRCIASSEYICVTDHYIIQLSAPVDKIVGKIAIEKITSVLVANNMLVVRVNKKEKRFTLISEVTLKQVCNFIETQRVTLSLCQVSLLS